MLKTSVLLRRFIFVLNFCLIGLLSAPVSAYPTGWELRATITDVGLSDVPAEFVPGASMRILIRFDHSVTPYRTRYGRGTDPLAPQNPLYGARYDYTLPQLQFDLYVGGDGAECNPCSPNLNPAYNPNNGFAILRDSFTDPANGSSSALEGITLGTTSADGLSMSVILRTPDPTKQNLYSGPQLPLLPDPRLAELATRVFQACDSGGNCVIAQIDDIRVPDFGGQFFLSARDCSAPDLNPASAFYGDDCIVAGGAQALAALQGGGLGSGNFLQSFAPVLGGNALGETYGEMSFSGPVALPVLKGRSLPVDISRNNANLLAFQQYQYSGAGTTVLPLVVDLTYDIISNWTDPNPAIQTGIKAGGASIGAVLTLINSSLVSPLAVGAVANFNSLQCGSEASHLLPDGNPWPAGSIMATAMYHSDSDNPLQQGAQARQLKVVRCANNGEPAAADGTVLSQEPPQLLPDQAFIVATSMQTPSRGKWQWPSASHPAPQQNGKLDASHTLRVNFAPDAPPALVQALAAAIAPACSDCDFVPEVLPLQFAIRPDSTGCINPKLNGMLTTAIYGSSTVRVADLRIDSSLKLGDLQLRVKGKAPACQSGDLNGDAVTDLLCHFANESSNWLPGQVQVQLSGLLHSGVPVQGSASVCLKN